MANKGKKTAARQSQLNSRKRKKSKSFQVVDSRVNDSEISTSPADDNESLSQTVLAQETPKIEAPKPVKPVKSASTAAALSYPYLNRELIQISLTSLIVVAVLIGLNFSVFS